jgi:cytochrome b6-f complex iron-sulfur subunit
MTEPQPPTEERPSEAAPEEGNIWFRRSFLTLAGFWALFAIWGAAFLAFIRFLFPRALFEPPSVFRAGRPEDYTIGEVSTQFIRRQRVWIVRNEEGFIALLAQCTHLGCTPRWMQIERMFRCPCHGSGFTAEGVNFEGPAPTPLLRLAIELSEDGYLMVDRSRQYQASQWQEPKAILRV